MKWQYWLDATSAFLAIVLMAFTASIANGIIASMVAYVVLWGVETIDKAIRGYCVDRGWCEPSEETVEIVH
jgi:xanthine/uracil/vitamin C permease (AzgA family)